MKKIFNFALYDFANSAFTTIIITFIFATYFAKEIAPNPILGQSYWGWTIGITGFLVAIIGPIIGFILIKIFNLSGYSAGVLLIQSAMPSAILTYLIASMYSPKKIVDNISSMIVVSTLMSLITIPIIVFIALKYFS